MQAEIPNVAVAGKKVIPIVPYSVKGRYRNLKSLILLLAYAVYFSLPWLTWHGNHRAGQPLLFDLANSRFYVFDAVIFPQDLMILMAVMVLAPTLLFMAAAHYGRIFCGFFCFQTLWTDAYRFLEKWVQGEAQAQMRLRKQPWGWERVYKITLTHLLWVALALATALTFTLYFADAHTLLQQLLAGQAPMAAYTAIATITATTYAAAGFAREDICRVACPYGKFQSVMQDPATMTVVYDTARGEGLLGRMAPSKSLKTAADRRAQGHGDCIDCGYCVNVCPTGVDIRRGFQIDCISCGLCIDACDSIMTSIRQPVGLIRFGKMSIVQPDSQKLWSAIKKTGYLMLLLICTVFIGYKLTNISPFSASVQQQAQPLVTRLSNGDLKSRYILRLTNKSTQDERYRLSTTGLPANAVVGDCCYEVRAGKTYTLYFDLVLSPVAASQLKGFQLTITPQTMPEASEHYPLTYHASF